VFTELRRQHAERQSPESPSSGPDRKCADAAQRSQELSTLQKLFQLYTNFIPFSLLVAKVMEELVTKDQEKQRTIGENAQKAEVMAREINCISKERTTVFHQMEPNSSRLLHLYFHPSSTSWHHSSI
jgi:hypothetical protein